MSAAPTTAFGRSGGTGEAGTASPKAGAPRLSTDDAPAQGSIGIANVGQVSLRELEARLSAYMNAGAPEPVLQGTREEREAALRWVHRRGDSQMRTLVERNLERLRAE